MTVEVGDVTIIVNGEKMPPEVVEQMGMDLPSELTKTRSKITTWLDEVEDDRPVLARRYFHEISKQETKGGEESEDTGVGRPDDPPQARNCRRDRGRAARQHPVTFQLAEVAVPRQLYRAILERIRRFAAKPPRAAPARRG